MTDSSSNYANDEPQVISDVRSVNKINGWTKCTMIVILFTVCLERAAYYSLLGDLATFLNTQMKWAPAPTAVCVLLFSGVSWISCFIGGMLGDACLGRYDTIAIGLLLYVFGFISLPLLSNFKLMTGIRNEPNYGHQVYVISWLAVILLFISLGEGFFKSNMSPFGADQVMQSDQKQLHRFFSIYYSFINIGSLIGFGPMIYEEERNFFYGYVASVVSISTAAVLFMVPKSCLYKRASRAPTNVVYRIWKICKEGRRKRKRTKTSERSSTEECENLLPVQHWLDRASIKFGGSFLEVEVNEVKLLFDMIPPFGFLVVYYILYYQISGTFLLQGIHMNTTMFGFSIPAAWLSLMNSLFVLLFIPVVDKGIYPCLESFGFKVSQLSRMSFGMILGSVALVCAGLVEQRRLDVHSYVNNTISGKLVNATDLAIWLQIPQYGVAGISEVFVSVTGLEFAYTHAPRSMQSITTGLFFVANGFGSFLGSLLIGFANAVGLGILKSADTKYPPLKGHLYLFFYFLAALNAITWIFFVLYIYRRQRRRQTHHADRDKFSRHNSALSRSRYAAFDDC